MKRLSKPPCLPAAVPTEGWAGPEPSMAQGKQAPVVATRNRGQGEVSGELIFLKTKRSEA